MEDLLPYPYLSFEQGENNFFYFSEEIISTTVRPKNIRVSDRATLFNLLIGLNGYTVSSGVIDSELDSNIIAVPLDLAGEMHIGYIMSSKVTGSGTLREYLARLEKHCHSFRLL